MNIQVSVCTYSKGYIVLMGWAAWGEGEYSGLRMYIQ